MENVQCSATISYVTVGKDGSSIMYLKVPSSQLQELIKMVGMAQVSVTLNVTPDSKGKNLLNVVFSNIQLSDVQHDSQEDTEIAE